MAGTIYTTDAVGATSSSTDGTKTLDFDSVIILKIHIYYQLQMQHMTWEAQLKNGETCT